MAKNSVAKSVLDVTIFKITLIGSNGRSYNISDIINNIKIYENIFHPVITGTIQLDDGVSMVSKVQAHGNEFLEIIFGKPDATEEEKYKKIFRVWKITDRGPGSKGNIQSYILHFCSEELILSNQITLSKALRGGSVTEYVYRILTETLLANKRRVNKDQNFEQSLGHNDFVLTKYRPFEAIRYLSEHAFNENGSTFICFENKDGYNFLSLLNLFTRSPLTKLNYTKATHKDEFDKAPYNINSMMDFNILQNFNVIENTRRSAYNSRLLTLDLITQKFKSYDYSLVDTFNKKMLMDGNFPLNDALNRKDRAIYDARGDRDEVQPDLNYALTDLGLTNNPYFLSKLQRVNSTNIEKTLSRRKVQFNMLKNTELECKVPGNALLSVGYMVDVDIPAFTENYNTESLKDPYSGKYLITELQHNIVPGSWTTTMKLCKNSVGIDLDPFVLTDAYKTARSY